VHNGLFGIGSAGVVMKKKTLKKILAIESILTELIVRSHDGPAWSSRVQAERIFEVVKSKKARKKLKKPWEHMAIELPGD
jgi:hypothetical protein